MSAGARGGWLVLSAVLVGCAGFGVNGVDEVAEVEFPPAQASPWRTQGESILADPRAKAQIYAAALAFYRPPWGQSRWLDPEVLPEAPGSPRRMLAAGLTNEILDRLGDGFGRWEERKPDQSGARLWVSPVYALAADSARVVVRSGHFGAYHEGPATEQVFVLTRDCEGWVVAARGGAADR